MNNITDILSKVNVDVKISKSDLIEMLIAEKKEELNEHTQVLSEEHDALRDLLKKAKDKHSSAMLKLIKKVYGKEIKAAEKMLDVEAEYYVTDTVYKNNFYRNEKDYMRLARCNVGSSEGDPSGISGKVEFCIALNNEELNSMPTYIKYLELNDKIEDVLSKQNSLRHEKNNLHEMGQKAKAKLVRSILESTDQGKALLGSMSGAVRASNKALKGK